jgi:uncharacterized protein YbaA (DUF1428 family)
MPYIDGFVVAVGMQPDTMPMPFDGKRLIYGSFEVRVDV